jgi:hypothetical protein
MPSSDLFMLAAAAAFFGAMWLYLRLCARI